MPNVSLPGGKSAVIGLKMSEFRELRSSGALTGLEKMSEESSDLAQIYPVMARVVRSWDCTDMDGKGLDPSDPASYDELEPGTFMRLLGGISEYLTGGSEAKN